MWLWIHELKQLGFKQKSELYFQCVRGYGLLENQYLSAFLWTRNGRKRTATRFEFTEFHITTQLAGHNLHFYFHEIAEGEWELGGHTSTTELERLGLDSQTLVADAEEIAVSFLERLG